MEILSLVASFPRINIVVIRSGPEIPPTKAVLKPGITLPILIPKSLQIDEIESLIESVSLKSTSVKTNLENTFKKLSSNFLISVISGYQKTNQQSYLSRF